MSYYGQHLRVSALSAGSVARLGRGLFVGRFGFDVHQVGCEKSSLRRRSRDPGWVAIDYRLHT